MSCHPEYETYKLNKNARSELNDQFLEPELNENKVATNQLDEIELFHGAENPVLLTIAFQISNVTCMFMDIILSKISG